MLTDHPNLVMLEWWDGKTGGFAVALHLSTMGDRDVSFGSHTPFSIYGCFSTKVPRGMDSCVEIPSATVAPRQIFYFTVSTCKQCPRLIKNGTLKS